MPVSSQSFIDRWLQSAAAERANYQLFPSELCDFLDVPRPDPTRAEDHLNTYVFEKAVDFHNLDGSISQGRIDLYKRDHFILEAKQGSNPPELQTEPETGNLILTPPPPRANRQRRGTAVRGTHGWDEAMLKARFQAESYARALPPSEGWPAFLVTVDVGHSIELYADFSLTGRAYLPFPDPRSYRILLQDLTNSQLRDRLRALWLDPLSLDPARHTAKVTREIATKLATLARNLELKYPAKDVAEFLTRCIFTSFAEDVGLLPEKSWLQFLQSLRDREEAQVFPQMASALWQTMNEGGFSPILRSHVLKFNGGLFASTSALPLSYDQLGLLIEAADCNWRDVEPAIFGTLLERALDPDERLVIPTLVEPLRADWANVVAAIAELVNSGKQQEAIETCRAFHRQLCNTCVLDPACGSGNFLYVSLEHMKRLEGEVLETLVSLGETQQALEHTGLTVNPHQLLGIELNPRAAVVADLVLWIGYLQWHFRTRGDAQPPIPVIRNFHNIEHRDALMTWQQKVPAVDEDGIPITQWDGKTTKFNLTTSRDVPDESARIPVFHYLGAKKAAWPDADFIVGNPPFIGGKDIRSELSDGYVEALRKIYDDVPDSADFVMYWWQRAAELTRVGKLRRFGLITTNSLPQVFNRRVVAQNLNTAKDPLSLIFAIPDHPWLKALSMDEESASKAAAVRIAMTVGERGEHPGHLFTVVTEGDTTAEGTNVELTERTGKILSDLRIGVDVASGRPLESNEGLCSRGMSLHGSGFIVSPEQANRLGLGRVPSLDQHIRPYLNGRDLTGSSRNVMVIDLFGLTAEEVRNRFPEVYQWVHDHVKPERDQNNRASYRDNWWIFGEPRSNLRPALKGLPRYIGTVETAKHRIFVFLDASILPDNKLINFALSDAADLAILSSKIHLTWFGINQARIGFGNDPVYVKTRCFDPFPFPVCTEAQREAIRSLGEQLDAHRKRQQQLHPSLTLTQMYNVLEKLRANEAPQQPVILSEAPEQAKRAEGAKPKDPEGLHPATTARTFSTPEPEPLTEEDRAIYEAGLIGVLRDIHDQLDHAVFAAYGWPATLTDDEILARLVELNAARRAEEASGLIRWLRPDFQAPTAVPVARTLEGFIEEVPAAAPRKKMPWPATLPEQVRAVKDALRASSQQTPAQIAAGFRPASRARVTEILHTLSALGQVRADRDRFSL